MNKFFNSALNFLFFASVLLVAAAVVKWSIQEEATRKSRIEKVGFVVDVDVDPGWVPAARNFTVHFEDGSRITLRGSPTKTIREGTHCKIVYSGKNKFISASELK